ncbi:fibrobacter succinogenes major paralogous domain-containing protein [Reichenbachiella sp.]|uniref:fibrobacter succinogenes major paralogous domain-containing protein n=1 Tax=Reichenbachiella sp. TaxID=2184521 RepID=UPI003B5C6E4B
MKLFNRFSLLILFSLSIFSCDQHNDDSIQLTGEIQIDLQSISNNSSGRRLNVLLSDADAILITIENGDESSTEYNLTEIELYQIDGNYISQKISLPIGDYNVTEFLVIDADDNIIYITPLEGSSQAQNVIDPLPISFTITADEITGIEIEVISTEELSFEDFGLAGFNLSEVNLFSFLINASEQGNLDLLLSAEVEISSETYTFSKGLQAIANNSLVIKDGYSNYDLRISSEGYDVFTTTISRDSLFQHRTTPLTVELTPEGWSAGEDWIDSRDDKIYKTVQIGDQVWMGENLKATSLTDGTPIENIINQEDWILSNNAAYSWNSNDESTYEEYGILYNWYAVETDMLCPTSWHVATESEWLTLIEYAGGSEIAGGILKDTGNDFWASPNSSATDELGFTALPAGGRHDYSTLAEFLDLGKFGYWWTSTESTSTEAKNFGMFYNISRVDNFSYGKGNGLSVRCIKD